MIRKLDIAAMIVAANDHFASDSVIDIWASNQETSNEVDFEESEEGCEVAGQEDAVLVLDD